MANQAILTLDDIVKAYMDEEERGSLHNYATYYRIALRGLKDLHFDTEGVPKIVQLEPDTDNIVSLPEDFVKEVRVGIISSTGQLIDMQRNDNIIQKLDDCGNITNASQGDITGTGLGFGVSNTYFNHFRNGEVIGGFYGIGGQQSTGTFKINHAAGRIELGTFTSQPTIILEYLANPQMIDKDFRVHPFLETPLLNYIDWVSKRRKHKQYSQGLINDLHRIYVDSKIWAAVRLGASSKSEIKYTTKKNFTLAPKGL